MSEPGEGGGEAPAGERRRVLVAFVELVAERGYDDVDGAMIGRRAGLGRRAFGRHFPDRQACFLAARDWLEEAYLRRIAVASVGLEDWRQQLRAAAAETMRLVAEHPRQARFLTIETLRIGPNGGERHQVLAVRLAELLDRVRDELENPDAIPAATAGWVIGIFYDRVYQYLSSGKEAELLGQVPQLMFLAVSPYYGTDAGLAELRTPPP
jgi:AcrR family transcriptional regulator